MTAHRTARLLFMAGLLTFTVAGVVEGGPIPPTDDPFWWEPFLEFDVYLQLGSTGSSPGQGSGSHERGPYSHTIPLSPPWAERHDYGSYTSYKLDDSVSGGGQRDDLEFEIYDYFDAEQSVGRLDIHITQASGGYTFSMTKRFIIDFKVCGEVIIEDWGGQLKPDFKNHYGDSVSITIPEPATLALLAVGGLLLIRRRAAVAYARRR